MLTLDFILLFIAVSIICPCAVGIDKGLLMGKALSINRDEAEDPTDPKSSKIQICAYGDWPLPGGASAERGMGFRAASTLWKKHR